MTVNNYRRLRTDRGEQGGDKLNPGLWGKEVEQGNPVAATPEGGKPNAENQLSPEQVSGTAEGGPANPEVDLQDGFTDTPEGTDEPASEEPSAEEPSAEEPSAEVEPEDEAPAEDEPEA